MAFFLGLSSCAHFDFYSKVKTRTEIEYTYKRTKDYGISKWRKSSQKTGYERYDKKGNIIEKGEYGEIFNFSRMSISADSSINIVCGHGRNYKKIDNVHYYYYDSLGEKIKVEFWRFKDNKKSNLINTTTFEYDSKGKLIKETEYIDENIISRFEDYSKDIRNKIISNDSIFNFSNETITKIKEKNQDLEITDNLGRPIEKIHYYKDKFSYRQAFRYDKSNNIETELRYDDKPDSLWCINEWQYNYDRQLIRKLWKVVGSETETRDIYIYDKQKLLIKILNYNGEVLKSYKRYKYKFY